MKYSQIILNYINNIGITPYRLAKETGISESLFSKWKSNPTSDISILTLEKISNYFYISIELLLNAEMYNHETFEVACVYDKLDIQGKAAVKKLIGKEQMRISMAGESLIAVARGGKQEEIMLTAEEEAEKQKLIERQYPELNKNK